MNSHVEDPDLEASGTFATAQEEELLEMLEDEKCSGQKYMSEVEGIHPVNTELEPDEPLNEELPLEMRTRGFLGLLWPMLVGTPPTGPKIL